MLAIKKSIPDILVLHNINNNSDCFLVIDIDQKLGNEAVFN